MKRAVWLRPKGLGCLPDPPKLLKAWLGCQLPRLDSGEVGRGTRQSTSTAGWEQDQTLSSRRPTPVAAG